jgi:hypothetical protein
MEKSIESKTESKAERLKKFLVEIKNEYNATRSQGIAMFDSMRVPFDRNILSNNSFNITNLHLRELVKQLDPNAIIRKVDVVIRNNIEIGDALLAEAYVIATVYRLHKEPSVNNKEAFIEAAERYGEIKGL